MARKRRVVTCIRIDPDALAVLEWHARITDMPLRTWIQAMLEKRAEEITIEYQLPAATRDRTEPALGRFQPHEGEHPL